MNDYSWRSSVWMVWYTFGILFRGSAVGNSGAYIHTMALASHSRRLRHPEVGRTSVPGTAVADAGGLHGCQQQIFSVGTDDGQISFDLTNY